ncbi:hypothetical protein THIOKS11580013 [Thiocapsa sp. KS1]|nr:hypothetical protein THIOKS11580013 [Thiocapsa sp. KS1]
MDQSRSGGANPADLLGRDPEPRQEGLMLVGITRLEALMPAPHRLGFKSDRLKQLDPLVFGHGHLGHRSLPIEVGRTAAGRRASEPRFKYPVVVRSIGHRAKDTA